MTVSNDFVRALLGRFAEIFPPPTHSRNFDAVVEIWEAALAEFTKEQVSQASIRLVKKLKRYPYPADVAEEILSQGDCHV